MDERTPYEQLIDGISQFAEVIRAYYNALREQGFAHKDAMLLTIEYQKEIMGMGKPK